jgi:hypothetical protein
MLFKEMRLTRAAYNAEANEELLRAWIWPMAVRTMMVNTF